MVPYYDRSNSCAKDSGSCLRYGRHIRLFGISGSHDREYEGVCLLGCCAVFWYKFTTVSSAEIQKTTTFSPKYVHQKFACNLDGLSNLTRKVSLAKK